MRPSDIEIASAQPRPAPDLAAAASASDGDTSAALPAELALAVMEMLDRSVCVAELGGAIVAVNQAFLDASGLPRDEVIGQALGFNASGRQTAAELARAEATLLERGEWSGEIWTRRASGEAHCEKEHRRLLRGQDGAPDLVLCMGTDSAASKDAQRLLLWQAQHDDLTKFPNRALFRERLEHLLEQPDHPGGAVLLLDMDRFKDINAAVGPAGGDQVLIETAHRLALAVDVEDTVARLGGDEFALILPTLTDADALAQVSQAILTRLSEPFHVDGREVHATVSIGVSRFPTDGTDVDSLLQKADSAMYGAKDTGRNGVAFFETAMNEEAERRAAIEAALRQALRNKELELFYQPIVDIESNQVASVEALLRWHHPEWGMVSPGEFIPVAEATGLIVPIGLWIVETAAAQAEKWRAMGLDPFRIAVNISGRQLMQKNQADELVRLVNSVPPQVLTLEITESLLMSNEENATQFFSDVRKTGVKVALDDFGTGYSALSYLRQFDIDVLKIDKSFIDDIENSTSDLSLVATIISMGRTLGVQVVAEGVETDRQLNYLRSMGCDFVQGFYFCKPLAAPALEAFLAAAPLQRVG